MSNKRSLSADRRRRKTITALWVLALSAIVITLIVLEQTAILYILATLGLTALLAVVALTNLVHEDPTMDQAAVSDRNTATIGRPVSSKR